MKIKIVLLGLISVFLILSCSENDDLTNNFIIGKWELVADYAHINNKWVLDEEYKTGEELLEFTKDGYVIEWSNGEKGVTLTYSFDLKNNKLSIFGIVMDVEVSENQLIIYNPLTFDPEIDLYKEVYKRLE